MISKIRDFIVSLFRSKKIYRCTRCGMTDITARELGCSRAPCPME